ncbi:MAG: PKD domain-containing protein [Saprospiraceae bacterium]
MMGHFIKFLLIICFFSSFAAAQTQIKGVINNYYKVVKVDTCLNVVRTAASHSFVVGDRILLIQMKGANINESNTSAFGNVFSLRGAGEYEINTIDSVFIDGFRLRYNMLFPYDPSFLVQVVSIPTYINAIVSDTLSALPWDGSIGGILALDAVQLELAAPIDVSGKGFRGGKGLKTFDSSNNCSWIVSVSDYHLPRKNWRGAEKGEGIAEFIPNKECGRGAQFTGGGGGNDHNSGGGGGANISKGGNGGKNDDPGNFSCQGPNPGVGGKAVGIPNAVNHFYLGAGGGAGHGNNGFASDGGNGGGMIFLTGKNLKTNAQKISANGISSSSTYGDGGGGGGAGGTIVFDFEKSAGILNIEAIGGQGATINNRGEQRCFGPGGGGAGGRIIYSSPFVANENVSGGKNGVSTNGSCQNAANGAQSGDNGIVEVFQYLDVAKEPFLALGLSVQPASDTICVGGIAKISLKASGKGLKYQWQSSVKGSGTFSNVPNNAQYTGSLGPVLTINNFSSSLINYEFQCVVSTICGQTIISKPIQLFADSIPKIDFNLNVLAAQLICTNKTANAISYTWDFGDNNTSIFTNPTHLYTTDGKFTVGLTARNRCGAAFKQQDIEIVTPPLASFRADTIQGCAPLKVRFVNTSSQNVTGYLWRFQGADISVSNAKDPVVTYTAGGVFGVTLIVTNSKFKDSLSRPTYISVAEKPSANFSISILNSTVVDLKNLTSNNATAFRWDFNTGFSSVQKDLQHDLLKDGDYLITLTASNVCGSNQIVKSITIQTLPKAGFANNVTKACVPVTIQFSSQASANTTKWFWRFPGADKDTASQINPKVTYSNAGTYDVSLVVTNAKGKDSIFKKAIIITDDKPLVGFDSKINRLTVEFQSSASRYNSILWDFGAEGKTATTEKATMIYPASGTYKVSLTAKNNCGERKLEKEIIVSNELSCDQIEVLVVPNPIVDYAIITFNTNRFAPIPYLISTVDGKVIRRGEIPKDTKLYELNFENAASGVYILYLKCETKIHTIKILKTDY